jgi:hypothetical protein
MTLTTVHTILRSNPGPAEKCLQMLILTFGDNEWHQITFEISYPISPSDF